MQTETIETIEEIQETNELAKAGENINKGLAAFNDKKAELETLAKSAADITINGIEDKEGYKKADAKRKELKAERVAISKEGKSMRDMLTVVSKNIISKEKELIDIISGEEKRLVEEQDKIDAEKERIRLEEIRKEEERIQSRVDGLRQYGYEIDLSALKSLSDEDYSQLKETAKTNYEAEQARLEAERLKAEKKAEEDRLAREENEKKLREQQEEIRKQQDELRELREAKEKAEREKKEAEDREKRAKELQEAKEKAAEEARKKALEEAENKRIAEIQAEKDRKDAEEKERLRKEEEARIKAEQAPDRTKINEYIKSIKELEVPAMKSANGKKIMASIQELVTKLTSYSTEKANTL